METNFNHGREALAFKKLLASKIKSHRQKISDWYREHARIAPPPFYCSIDLRDSGHKIVPVDSNLFPAGFNNICSDDIRAAPAVVREKINSLLEISGSAPGIAPKKILILPESHTTNTYYIENLWYLSQICLNAGFEVQIGWVAPLAEPIHLKSFTEKEIVATPIRIENGTLSAGDFTPDLILLNNDFSAGYPKNLDEVKQPIVPSHRLGWHTRRKTEHFRHYNRLAGEFAQITGIDPWSIQIETREVADVNFNEDHGVERIAAEVHEILNKTQAAYDQRGIKTPPFVFVKNNSGTYGIGIMVVHSADELLKMNRRTKNKMSVGKNHKLINSVAVQEGVPTATLVDRLAAEPVIYLVGCELIGGFLRTNTERGIEENLNSQGMVFKKLCMSDLKSPIDIQEAGPEEIDEHDEEPLLELVYGSIARISALATGLELAEHTKRC